MTDTIVPNLVHLPYKNNTNSLYGMVFNASLQVRDVANSNWEAFPGSGSLVDYDIDLGTPVGLTWKGGFPQEVSNGFYIYQVRYMLGDDPDEGDELVGAAKGYWNATSQLFLSSNISSDGGVVLASDGLNFIDQTEPVGVPGTWDFREWFLWLLDRLAGKHIFDKNTNKLKVYDKAGSSQLSQQTTSEIGNIETVEEVVTP